MKRVYIRAFFSFLQEVSSRYSLLSHRLRPQAPLGKKSCLSTGIELRPHPLECPSGAPHSCSRYCILFETSANSLVDSHATAVPFCYEEPFSIDQYSTRRVVQKQTIQFNSRRGEQFQSLVNLTLTYGQDSVGKLRRVTWHEERIFAGTTSADLLNKLAGPVEFL